MKTALLYHEDLKRYSFGGNHPFQGNRFFLFWNFFQKTFSPFKDRFEIIKPEPAQDDLLKLVHTQDYIEAVKYASSGLHISDIFNYFAFILAKDFNSFNASSAK